MRTLTLGTRGSSLAMCQAQIVRTLLEAGHPPGSVRVRTITARADQQPDRPLTSTGEEGVFVRELETSLLARQIDVAVHSMKDVPLETPGELAIAAILERDEPRDALVSSDGLALAELPSGARIGTSSLRRRSQVWRQRRDVQCLDIRGNVDTRLRKLDEGQYDAIVVAACGLIRLGLEERITEYLDLATMLPEPGQGALAIEIRTGDEEVREAVAAFDDPVSRACVEAERAFLASLGGGCRVPIAAYCAHHDGTLELDGTVVAADGGGQVRGQLSGPVTEPVALGARLGHQLESQGARELLANG